MSINSVTLQVSMSVYEACLLKRGNTDLDNYFPDYVADWLRLNLLCKASRQVHVAPMCAISTHAILLEELKSQLKHHAVH
jgi:hypothetical protein